MNLSGFIDKFKEAIAKRVVESYPPLYRPSETPVELPKPAPHPDGWPGGRHQGNGPLPTGPPGHHRGGRNGHGQDLHRRRRRSRRRVPAGVDTLPTPFDSKMEAGGGGHGAPGASAAIVTSITDLERLQLSVGPAPLFAIMSREKAKLSYRWQPAVIQRWAAAGGRLVRDEQTGESPSGCPAAPPVMPRWWTRTGFLSLTRSFPASAATATYAVPPSGRPTAPAPNGIRWPIT